MCLTQIQAPASKSSTFFLVHTESCMKERHGHWRLKGSVRLSDQANHTHLWRSTKCKGCGRAGCKQTCELTLKTALINILTMDQIPVCIVKLGELSRFINIPSALWSVSACDLCWINSSQNWFTLLLSSALCSAAASSRYQWKICKKPHYTTWSTADTFSN